VLRRQDGAGRKDAQAQQVGQVARVGLVTAVLEPIIFFYCGGVGQMDHEAGSLQAVDKPVPVVRGFDHDACQLGSPRGKERQNLCQVVRQSLFSDHAVRFVDHAHHAVVRMQVAAAIVHDDLLPVKAVLATSL